MLPSRCKRRASVAGGSDFAEVVDCSKASV